ncbi:MOSC domain-containing protein [Deinococcus metallilatus]|uniref:MOSC domain-containing protein n=1 Tax=Deinococcus metallilatus TaxID=1211322 RepID=A0AAJ5K4U3_9DEIO|nr:MOSC domain-containing protein [Deinococcus metallilatus]MBB5295211.1 MOSC domain-containing protein YiiM [Deinococcus metallilatus]QBY08625.1 MOSC domain-containing protein [Deinococcus metallilatus]RXJ10504.1 MOSC domain-containing protein [Deinococcus metallilatus]TLK26475.1 MOSC domain-containing protein [Deinococcus metallilatus]GMA14985.1 molybdenum cofactor biosynthesis protein [Deinococcus metallilatus]
MKLISVNIGQPTAVQIGQRMAVTGICKHPVPGRVRVTAQGLDGDHVLDRKHHGGPDQAVYIYTREDYDHWAEALGAALEPGTFGENLLIGGLESAGVQVGERFRVGSVLLEVTAPRIPCGTLGARMADAGFVKRFARARRPGFYTRVLEGGDLGRGDEVTRAPAPAEAPTIAELFDLWYEDTPSRATLERYLHSPLAVRLRRNLEERLADARSS